MSARTTRLLLDVTWDPAVEDKPTTWQWNHGIEPRATGSIVVVGEVTGRDDELLTVLEELHERTAEKPGELERLVVAAALRDDLTEVVRLTAKADGMRVAASYIREAINEHTPEPPDLDGEDLFPARRVSHRDRLTDLALEATE